MGEDIVQVKVSNEGAPGDTAYEVAVIAGFVGTVAEWLLFLKGATGDTGADSTIAGPKGDTGATGAQGDTGDTGPQGDTGADSTVAGPKGDTGADSTVAGPKGDTGDPGADSTVAGPKGETGDTGADSTIAGPKGDTGATGAQGDTGDTGPQGDTGADSTVAGPKGDTGDTGADAPTPILDTTAATSVLPLVNSLGNYFTGTSGAAKSLTTYTTTGTTLGAYVEVLINTATEPTVTGATKVSGAIWTADVNMYLIVRYNGTRVEFFFLDI